MSYGLNDEIEALREEIKQLKSENDKLKTELEEAERWSMFNLPVGTRVLINRLLQPTSKKRRKKA